MIILKLNEDVSKKKKRLWQKINLKEELFDYTRAGVIINNRPHFVISVNENNLCDESFKKMLSRYKGEIITSEKLLKYEFLNELLFDEKPYIKRALFKNFESLLKNKEAKMLNLLVVDSDFDLKEKLPMLLPNVKTLTVKVKNNFFIKEWQKKCFLEYGVKPNVVFGEELHAFSYDVIADFDNIKYKTLFVEFLGETKTVNPANEFFEIPEELKFLKNFGLENSTICAAFCSSFKK